MSTQSGGDWCRNSLRTFSAMDESIEFRPVDGEGKCRACGRTVRVRNHVNSQYIRMIPRHKARLPAPSEQSR